MLTLPALTTAGQVSLLGLKRDWSSEIGDGTFGGDRLSPFAVTGVIG